MTVQFPALKRLVMVFALVLANTSPAQLSILMNVTLSQVIAVAGPMIYTGSSLAGTSLRDLAVPGYSVTCTILVENWTRFTLLKPTVRQNTNAVITSPATTILPGERQALALRKADHTATGVYGTVSWEVGEEDRRFVIMWSAPFDHTYYSNWMGLGMTESGVTKVPPDMEWFDQMYYRESSVDLTFKRAEYYYVTDHLVYRNDKFVIDGSMTNNHRAQIIVVVRPTEDNWQDLAGSIKYGLLKNQQRGGK